MPFTTCCRSILDPLGIQTEYKESQLQLENTDDLKVGDMVAIKLENYEIVPVIGEVLKVDGDTFEMQYYKGSFEKPWRPWMVTQGRQKVSWCDNLPRNCIVLFAFKLRKDNKLSAATVKSLKDIYGVSDEL